MTLPLTKRNDVRDELVAAPRIKVPRVLPRWRKEELKLLEKLRKEAQMPSPLA